MSKVYIGKTINGFDVYLDEENSHAVTHFEHSPKLLGAVKKVIPLLEPSGDVFRIDYDMKEEIGTTDLVETDETDEIVYALRPRRTQYSRFVKNRESLPTTWITLDLRKVEKDYFLYTAFVGRLTPSFPGGDFLPEQSHSFWSSHALVWGSQDVLPGTETQECPW